MSWEETDLWKRAFEGNKAKHKDQRNDLKVAYRKFRKNVEQMAELIAKDVPALTDHSVKHLDALWEMASILVPKDLLLNPAEVFVLGGAILLHDLGNCVAAFPGGLRDLKGPQWDDIVTATYYRHYGRMPTPEERETPAAAVFDEILLHRLRQAHAEQAEHLATLGFFDPTSGAEKPERTYLIEDQDCRRTLGPLVGRLAHSHHWSIDRVAAEFEQVWPAPPPLPPEWQIDALKIACLLRLADAMQIDVRRAPAFSMALRNPTGVSRIHWTFQSLLNRPIIQNERLVYRSFRPFRPDEADAWWLCFDTLGMIHAELSAVDDKLRALRDFRLTAAGVEGHDDPKLLQRTVGTQGWIPVDARVRVGDAIGIAQKFGGQQLYGDKPWVALRELLANASDAVRARRVLEPKFSGRIAVRRGGGTESSWIEVEDNGIGMSTDVMAGPLLDFGTSYWSSALARKEHPGLFASGFSPTGKFGIGFFSVFMLGDRVRVVSRPTSGYRGGESTTRVLEFENGLTSRPLLRLPNDGDPTERRYEPGSTVRVWLKQDMTDIGQDLVNAREDLNARGSLIALVGRIAPALDTQVVVEDEGYEAKEVIEANDWPLMAPAVLHHRLYGGFPVGGNLKIRIEKTTRLFELNGTLLGRLWYTGSQHAKPFCTVGGLRTETELSLFERFNGILCASNPNLARTIAEAPHELPGLQQWLESVEEALMAGSRSHEDLILAEQMAGLGVMPMRLPVFHFNHMPVSLGDLAAMELPDPLWIVSEYVFGIIRDNTVSRVWTSTFRRVQRSAIVLPRALRDAVVSRKAQVELGQVGKGSSLLDVVLKMLVQKWGQETQFHSRDNTAELFTLDGKPLQDTVVFVTRRGAQPRAKALDVSTRRDDPEPPKAA